MEYCTLIFEKSKGKCENMVKHRYLVDTNLKRKEFSSSPSFHRRFIFLWYPVKCISREGCGMKILVVEDEPTLNKIIAKRLKIETYSVDCAFNGKEALEYLDAAEYDLLIVDIMMPEMDGLTLVKKIREKGGRVPVLFLTALDSTQDKVTGLDSGGDDYLVKPFEFDELLARIRSLLRRSNVQQTARTQLTLADLTLDTRTHQVTRSGQEISLTPKEFSVLDYLLRNQGTVLSREQILEHAWDFSYEGYSNMVDVYIKTLRKKIDKDFEPKLLHTVRGTGYVLKV